MYVMCSKSLGFNEKKIKSKGGLVEVFKYLKGCHEEEGGQLFCSCRRQDIK